jgi:hypothetical protein
MTTVAPVSPTDVILGVTHLLADGQLTPLLKCPFCNSLRNIHVEVIEHHIRFSHPGKSYQASKFYHKGARASSPYGSYISKKEIKLPWIRCLFCSYKDKIEFDLSLHLLEEHKQKLLQIPISARDRTETNLLKESRARFFSKFEGSMEFRLDVAVEMAKEENRGLGVKHAIKLIQKRVLERRRARETQK